MSKISKKIAIASDHAGFELKAILIEHLVKNNYKIEDLGCSSAAVSVDYPDFAFAVAKKIVEKKADFGVLICGSGIGVSIAANREKQVRAALCMDENMAKLSRLHNDANIICFGARLISQDASIKALETFLNTEFEGNRHEVRVKKMS